MTNDSGSNQAHRVTNHPSPENDLLPLLRNPIERNLLQFNPFIGLDDALPSSPQRFRRVLSGHCSPQIPIDYRNLGSGDLSVTASSSHDSREVEDPPSLSNLSQSAPVTSPPVSSSTHAPHHLRSKTSSRPPTIRPCHTPLAYSVASTPVPSAPFVPASPTCYPNNHPADPTPPLPSTPVSPSRRLFNALVTRKSRRPDPPHPQNPHSPAEEHKRSWNPIRRVCGFTLCDTPSYCDSSALPSTSPTQQPPSRLSVPNSSSPKSHPLRRGRSMRALVANDASAFQVSTHVQSLDDSSIAKLPQNVAAEGGLSAATVVTDTLAASGRRKWPKRRTSLRMRDPRGRGKGRFGGRRETQDVDASPVIPGPVDDHTASAEPPQNTCVPLLESQNQLPVQRFGIYDQNAVEPGTTVSLHVESFMRWRTEDDQAERTQVVDEEDESRAKTESELSLGRTSLASLFASP